MPNQCLKAFLLVVITVMTRRMTAAECSAPNATSAMNDRLEMALRTRDKVAAEAAVREVCADEMARTYRLDHQARDLASRLVCSLKLLAVVPELRRVATLDVRDGDRWLNEVAVSGALNALTCLRDEQAVSLNRAALGGDAMMISCAVNNLKELADWDSSERVASIMLELRVSPTNAMDRIAVGDAATFLIESPKAGASACRGVIRCAEVFRKCISAPGPEYSGGCPVLKGQLESLNQKLSCGAGAGPEAKEK